MTKSTKKKKKNDDNVTTANLGIIVIFPIFCLLGAKTTDSGGIVYNTYIFNISDLLCYKN